MWGCIIRRWIGGIRGFFLPDLQRQSAEAMREQYPSPGEGTVVQLHGPIDVLWFDGGEEQDWLDFGGDYGKAQTGRSVRRASITTAGSSWQHDLVYAMIRQLQPQVIINGRADMPEDFHSREGDGRSATSMTNIRGSFAPHSPERGVTSRTSHRKSLKDCIQLLAKGGGPGWQLPCCSTSAHAPTGRSIRHRFSDCTKSGE